MDNLPLKVTFTQTGYNESVETEYTIFKYTLNAGYVFMGGGEFELQNKKVLVNETQIEIRGESVHADQYFFQILILTIFERGIFKLSPLSIKKETHKLEIQFDLNRGFHLSPKQFSLKTGEKVTVNADSIQVEDVKNVAQGFDIKKFEQFILVPAILSQQVIRSNNPFDD